MKCWVWSKYCLIKGLKHLWSKVSQTLVQRFQKSYILGVLNSLYWLKWVTIVTKTSQYNEGKKSLDPTEKTLDMSYFWIPDSVMDGLSSCLLFCINTDDVLHIYQVMEGGLGCQHGLCHCFDWTPASRCHLCQHLQLGSLQCCFQLHLWSLIVVEELCNVLAIMDKFEIVLEWLPFWIVSNKAATLLLCGWEDVLQRRFWPWNTQPWKNMPGCYFFNCSHTDLFASVLSIISPPILSWVALMTQLISSAKKEALLPCLPVKLDLRKSEMLAETSL